ncbi:glycosyltransferase family 2 protein [Candidatus Uhrbacteria bacterium]|nr:glycosyltransferase family 2 protein [Candidatus Uhrbacteria bacterium]
MISVIIPAYNSAKQLPETLDAVYAQTIKDIEVIVVDDGSIDDTIPALECYRDRIKLITQGHAGRCAARNRGFAESKGDYVIFIDAAAVMKPRMLETLYEALQKTAEPSFAYSAFKWRWKTFSSFPYDAELLKNMNYIHTSALIRRESFAGFDEKIEKFNDWDLWLTMMENGHYGIYVPEVLFVVRPHRATASAWVPSFFYKIPWHKLGIRVPAIEKYEKWKRVIQQKHGITNHGIRDSHDSTP